MTEISGIVPPKYPKPALLHNMMQDKIQNDMMYGDKASKAILSNLSYQFFERQTIPTPPNTMNASSK